MCPYLQFPADLVTFTEEILNGKLYFLCYWTKKSTKVSEGYLRVTKFPLANDIVSLTIVDFSFGN